MTTGACAKVTETAEVPSSKPEPEAEAEDEDLPSETTEATES